LKKHSQGTLGIKINLPLVKSHWFMKVVMISRKSVYSKKLIVNSTSKYWEVTFIYKHMDIVKQSWRGFYIAFLYLQWLPFQCTLPLLTFLLIPLIIFYFYIILKKYCVSILSLLFSTLIYIPYSASSLVARSIVELKFNINLTFYSNFLLLN
jgi:hypothetical protein